MIQYVDFTRKRGEMLAIEKNITLAPYTTFRIGGPATFFVTVSSEKEIVQALQWAKKRSEPIFFLGSGSNVLISDTGIRGLVIHMDDTDPEVDIHTKRITCFAGCRLMKAVEAARDHALAGMENMAGIPGTVGGAVRGNAGAFGTEIQDVLFSARAIRQSDLTLRDFTTQECNFHYRTSVFKSEEGLVISRVVFRLSDGESQSISQHMKDIIAQRNARQKQDAHCAGSFFVNPVVPDASLISLFEKEAKTKSRENKVPAGWLIDKVGLRGKRIRRSHGQQNAPELYF